MRNELKIFSGQAHVSLAEDICKKLDLSLGVAHISRFSNDNLFVSIEESVRDADVFVVQPSCYPVDTGLMELLLLIDALKRASAGRISAVVPYYPYARSDKKDQPRIPITARLVGDLLTTAGAQRIVTIDLHAPQIQGFFSIPVDHLTAIPILLDYFKKKEFYDLVVVSPDAGGAKLAELYSRNLNAPYAILDKRRCGIDRAQVRNVIGDVRDRDLLIIDDEISTAGSLRESVGVLKEHGARDIYVGCTHPIFSGSIKENLFQLDIVELVVTNTVPVSQDLQDKVKVLSVASLLAEAIKRIHSGGSISQLFHQETGGMM